MLTVEKYNELYKQYNNLFKKMLRQYPLIEDDDAKSIKGWAIWRAYDSFDESMNTKFCTYLYKVFKNECNRIMVKKLAKKRVIFHQKLPETLDCCKNLASLEKYNELITLNKEPVELPLHILPKRYRKIILLFLKGYNGGEVAHKMKFTVARANQIRQASILKMRQYIIYKGFIRQLNEILKEDFTDAA
jgi:DNA-directed RNA polymerase specialized sigma subunit